MNTAEKRQMEIVEEYIEQLLTKAEGINSEDIDIHSLDSPLKRMTMHESRQSTVAFEVMRVINGKVQLGGLYLTPATHYLLLDGVVPTKYWITTAKIKQLLLDHPQKSAVRKTYNGESFFVLLDKQLLLDNAVTENS